MSTPLPKSLYSFTGDIKDINKYRIAELKAYGAAEYKRGTEALQAVTAERDALKDDLAFVERWANHHGQKPCHTPPEILSVIQHYPAIKAITKGYTDGVIPETSDPFAERDALKADAEKYREALEQITNVGGGLSVCIASEALEGTS